MNLFKDHRYPMATEFPKWESTLESTHSRYPLYLVTAEEGGCLLVAPRAAANESVSTHKRASALTPPAQTALSLPLRIQSQSSGPIIRERAVFLNCCCLATIATATPTEKATLCRQQNLGKL